MPVKSTLSLKRLALAATLERAMVGWAMSLAAMGLEWAFARSARRA